MAPHLCVSPLDLSLSPQLLAAEKPIRDGVQHRNALLPEPIRPGHSRLPENLAVGNNPARHRHRNRRDVIEAVHRRPPERA
jgi:hypothetical protein